MREFAMGFFACLAGTMIAMAVNMFQQDVEDETNRLSMRLLEKFTKYGSVILMTDLKEATETSNNAVIVKNEKWFWRVFKEFNRASSRLFDDKTISANIHVEVDIYGKKQYKYYFEHIDNHEKNGIHEGL